MARYIVHGHCGNYAFQSVPDDFEGTENDHVIELNPEADLDLKQTEDNYYTTVDDLLDYQSRLANDPELRVKKKPSVPS